MLTQMVCWWSLGWKKSQSARKKSVSLLAEEPDDNDDGDGEAHDTHDDGINEQTLQEVLDSEARLRPLVNLVKPHYDLVLHLLSIRYPLMWPVLVPIGPTIPHQDNINCYSWYCQLMLIFFKCWHTAADLWGESWSWTEAFEQFMLSNHGNAARPTMGHTKYCMNVRISRWTISITRNLAIGT